MIGEHTNFYTVENGVRIPTSLPTVRTYRGKVKDDPNTLVFFAAQPNGKISGYIRFDDRDFFQIEQLPSHEAFAAAITPMSSIPNVSELTKCGMEDESKYVVNPIISSGKTIMLGSDTKPLAASQTAIVNCDLD